MRRKKKNAKHRICLIYVLIWYLIVLLNILLVYVIPYTRSFYSFQRLVLVYIPLGIIASISLYVSLKKSFKKNIIYVHIIFVLLASVPILCILTNIISVKIDDEKWSLLETDKISCSGYPERFTNDNLYVRFKEASRDRYNRFFAKEWCVDVKQNHTPGTYLVEFPSETQEQGKWRKEWLLTAFFEWKRNFLLLLPLAETHNYHIFNSYDCLRMVDW